MVKEDKFEAFLDRGELGARSFPGIYAQKYAKLG